MIKSSTHHLDILIDEVFCRGEKKHSTYFRNWMALAVQKVHCPDKVPTLPQHATVVLRGPRGTGKSTLMGVLAQITKPHSETYPRQSFITDLNKLGQWRGKKFIALEEFVWPDRHEDGHPKFRGMLKLANENAHVIIATKNARDFIPVPENMGEFHFLHSSTEYWKNEDARMTWFSELHDEIEADDLKSFSAELLARDISGFYPNIVPNYT